MRPSISIGIASLVAWMPWSSTAYWIVPLRQNSFTPHAAHRLFSQASTTGVTATSNSDKLTLNVGGYQYKVNRALLLKFPDSFFDKMLAGGKEDTDAAVIEIQRDGELFKFVYDYMFYGALPRNDLGAALVSDSFLLNGILQEAEFYQLPGLVTECQALLRTCEAEQVMKPHAKMLDEIGYVKWLAGNRRDNKRCKVVYRRDEESDGNDLIDLLRRGPYAPAWITGRLRKGCNPRIFKSTSVMNMNVTELKAAASPSPFGRGNETVYDTQVRDSWEIPASKCRLRGLEKIASNIDISSWAPNMKLTLKPYKLVIYEQGGHFEGHRDTVRDERHIGTLVLILNSDYTGGELEVCHGQQKLGVAGALKWVAMYGDCMHTIHPVTSGTRVSLIFDIWNEQEKVSSKKMGEKTRSRNKREDDDEYDDDDWNDVEYEDEHDDEKENVQNTNEGENDDINDEEKNDEDAGIVVNDEKDDTGEEDNFDDDQDDDDDDNFQNASKGEKDDFSAIDVDDMGDNEYDEKEARRLKRYWASLGEAAEEIDEEYAHEFWKSSNGISTGYWRDRAKAFKASKTTPSVAPAVDIENIWNQVYEALDKELEEHGTISICLDHLYPVCQANPDFLKGDDARLYQMLKDKYSLGVASLILARIDLDGPSYGINEFGAEKLLNSEQVTLFVPYGVRDKSIVHYSPGSDYTGNEAQQQESVYLVAALVVRQKEVSTG